MKKNDNVLHSTEINWLFPGISANLPSVLEQVSDGIYITDINRKILYWNRAAETITGYKAAEVLGKRCADNILVHVDMAGNKLCSTDLCPLHNAMVTGKASATPLTVKAKHKLGHRVFVEVSLSPLHDADQKVVGGIEIFRDISDKVALEEQKARFFSALSHELKTPLTNMQGYLDLLLEGDAGELNAIQEEFITTIYGEEQKLAGVIDELLEMGHFESTDFSYVRNALDLSPVLENLCHSFEAEAKRKSLSLNCHLASGLTLIGDRERLTQAIGNLISNAIKYTEKGGINVSAIYNRESSEIVISVADSGMGIPPGELDAIFEMFYRVENPGTRSKGGTGVGLYIVKRIIERHDGKVTVESTPGKGSQFKVFLPGSKL